MARLPCGPRRPLGSRRAAGLLDPVIRGGVGLGVCVSAAAHTPIRSAMDRHRLDRDVRAAGVRACCVWALERTIPRLAVASWIHGIHGFRSIRTLLPPLFLPLGAAGGIVYLALLGNFGVPQILGAPVGVVTLATAAYARLLSPGCAASAWRCGGCGCDPGAAQRPGTRCASPHRRAGFIRAPSGRTRWGRAPVPDRVRLHRVWLAAVRPRAYRAVQPVYGRVRPAVRRRTFVPVGPVRGAPFASCARNARNADIACGRRRSRTVRRRVAAAPAHPVDPNYLLPGTMLSLGLIFLLVRTPLYATPMILFLAYALHFRSPRCAARRGGLGRDRPAGFRSTRPWHLGAQRLVAHRVPALAAVSRRSRVHDLSPGGPARALTLGAAIRRRQGRWASPSSA